MRISTSLLAIVLSISAATLFASECPFRLKEPPTRSDERRASIATPSSPVFTAKGASAIRLKLNEHLKSGELRFPSAANCEDFTLEQLATLQQTLLCHTDESLVKLSGGHKSNLRSPRHKTTDELAKQHAAEAALVQQDKSGTVAPAIRDTRCHDIAMSWVHHLSADSRSTIADKNKEMQFPLLPSKGLEEHTGLTESASLHTEVRKAVLGNLSSAVTCQIGHEATPQARGTWEGFPTWPYEVEYNASGYGPYPFWAGGGGSGGSLSGPGADIHTWWSAVHNAERLDHSSCSLSSLGATDGPCTHLFLNGSWAFLYKQDQSFCCMSSAPVQYTPCHLTRPQRNFMDVMTYNGVIKNYTSEDGLYSGPAKKYSMHLTNPSNFWFWYVTDMQDRPLEQGEGPCDMYDQWGSRYYCESPPKMLFHQYHTDTFKSTTIDPSVFDLPDVCKKTPYTYCMVQPTNFCG